MKILAIETSCDETAAAVVENGRYLRSNVIATQIELHRRFGGVFPEVASRQHVLSIQPVIEQVLSEAGIAHVRQLDAIAVTHGPGLAGSLLVGVNAAKGLAFASGLPLLPVNHLEGHIYSNWIEVPSGLSAAAPSVTTGVQDDHFPALVLIISGGHTELILMTGHGQYRQIGATLDDAAGEAFDKVARLLDLGFPGGPAIQTAAARGDSKRFALPRALRLRDENRFNFSFSGLKTAVLNLVRELEKEGKRGRGGDRETGRQGFDVSSAEREREICNDSQFTTRNPQLAIDIAASFQAALVDQVVDKLANAAREFRVQQVCICGGVSANAALRLVAQERIAGLRLPLYIPHFSLCTDNAAMIGAAAYFRYRADLNLGDGLDTDVFANLPLTIG